MTDQGACAVKQSASKRLIRRFSRWSWRYTMPVASFIHTRTKKYLEPPMNHRFLAGLSEACWMHVCGYDLKFSLHIGMIYWKPVL